MKHPDDLKERVARAICGTEAALNGGCPHCDGMCEAKSKELMEFYGHQAQAALDAAFEWRDISTAPRNQYIRIYVPNPVLPLGYAITCAEFRDGSDHWMDMWGEAVCYPDEPTHWLPIPPAPEE